MRQRSVDFHPQAKMTDSVSDSLWLKPPTQTPTFSLTLSTCLLWLPPFIPSAALTWLACLYFASSVFASSFYFLSLSFYLDIIPQFNIVSNVFPHPNHLKGPLTQMFVTAYCNSSPCNKYFGSFTKLNLKKNASRTKKCPTMQLLPLKFVSVTFASLCP